MGLIDLGFSGCIFTWNYIVSVETRRSTMLDRAMCDDNWRRRLPDANVKHLAHSHSDHCPLLLRLQTNDATQVGDRPFKFQMAWLIHEDFFKWIGREWKWNGNLTKSLKDFSLKAWNKDILGNVF